MTTPAILAFAGSTRTDSLNKRLVRQATLVARDKGFSVTLADLHDFPMPMYDGDLERTHGLPDSARAFKALMVDHPGMLIAAPEYNSSLSAVLKNAIDWASRPQPGEPPAVAFRGKLIGLLAASPGALGGIRGLATLRPVLSGLGALVAPTQFSVPHANDAFDAQGAFLDAARAQGLAAMIGEFCSTLQRLFP